MEINNEERLKELYWDKMSEDFRSTQGSVDRFLVLQEKPNSGAMPIEELRLDPWTPTHEIYLNANSRDYEKMAQD